MPKQHTSRSRNKCSLSICMVNDTGSCESVVYTVIH